MNNNYKKLPKVQWKFTAKNKKIEKVRISRIQSVNTSFLVENDWLSLDSLKRQGWVQKNAGKEFYPVQVKKIRNTYDLMDGYHRVSYANLKGDRYVLGELPTVFKYKLVNEPYIYRKLAWKYIQPDWSGERQTSNVLSVDVVETQLENDLENGWIKWYSKDGEKILR